VRPSRTPGFGQELAESLQSPIQLPMQSPRQSPFQAEETSRAYTWRQAHAKSSSLDVKSLTVRGAFTPTSKLTVASDLLCKAAQPTREVRADNSERSRLSTRQPCDSAKPSTVDKSQAAKARTFRVSDNSEVGQFCGRRGQTAFTCDCRVFGSEAKLTHRGAEGAARKRPSYTSDVRAGY
jgi:hypothetical protein